MLDIGNIAGFETNYSNINLACKPTARSLPPFELP